MSMGLIVYIDKKIRKLKQFLKKVRGLYEQI